MSDPTVTISSVVARFYSAYARTRRLRADVQRAARSIIDCGTTALGAHVQRCDCGHIERIRYNSCRHRCCPACRGGRRAQWLESISSQLLPCDHVHVIFTVPEPLNVFWRFNRRLFADLLLQSARESLLELLADPQYLGAQPGIVSALHTWGSNLSVHPHVHCLVTAGGVDASGEFVKQQRKTLLPARVLMIVFRAKLRVLLKAAIDDGRMALPASHTAARSHSLLNRLGRTAWNVRITERYKHGVSVAGYLARYITGGPLSDRRLHTVSNSEIAFRYRDYRDGREKLMRLAPAAFLDRWFEHVPPRGLRMIRRSGLYANCHAALRQRIRHEHRAEATALATPTVIALEPERCPLCNTPVMPTELSRPVFARQLADRRLPRLPTNQPP